MIYKHLFNMGDDWNNAYIIGGYPNSLERKDIAEKLGAELIHIDTDRDECIRRLQADTNRVDVVDEWTEYIDRYWDNYQPDSNSSEV